MGMNSYLFLKREEVINILQAPQVGAIVTWISTLLKLTNSRHSKVILGNTSMLRESIKVQNIKFLAFNVGKGDVFTK